MSPQTRDTCDHLTRPVTELLKLNETAGIHCFALPRICIRTMCTVTWNCRLSVIYLLLVIRREHGTLLTSLGTQSRIHPIPCLVHCIHHHCTTASYVKVKLSGQIINLTFEDDLIDDCYWQFQFTRTPYFNFAVIFAYSEEQIRFSLLSTMSLILFPEFEILHCIVVYLESF